MHAASPKGFAAVARDHAGAALHLHELMVPHPAATFFMRASGDAMAPFLCNGDLMVVDRSRPPRDGLIVVVSVDGRWIARRWEHDEGESPEERGVILRADNPRYPVLRATRVAELEVFGVVTWVARKATP